MEIVIKKKVTLEFLGDEYKNAYLVFRSMPLKDYSTFMTDVPKTNPRYKQLIIKAESEPLTTEELVEFNTLQEEESSNNIKNLNLIIECLKKYFLTGMFPNDTGELIPVNDPTALEGLDQDSAVKCFTIFTGQELDPKV